MNDIVIYECDIKWPSKDSRTTPQSLAALRLYAFSVGFKTVYHHRRLELHVVPVTHSTIDEPAHLSCRDETQVGPKTINS